MPDRHRGRRSLQIDVPEDVRDELAARAARAGRSPDYEALAPRAWVLRHSVTVYDAAYVALAEALDAPMMTLDLRLARAPGPRCPFLTPSDTLP
jgi:predicted nucleic acid-binding protein